MPAKKKSRTASRSKPALSNITNKLNAAQAQERHKKKDLIVEDFKKNGKHSLWFVVSNCIVPNGSNFTSDKVHSFMVYSSFMLCEESLINGFVLSS